MRGMIAHLVRKLRGPIDALGQLGDHLRGSNRVDFRRLFKATATGRRCWEMERFGFRPKKPVLEPSDDPRGFWLPGWTWDIVRDALRREHLLGVARGEESRVESVNRPAPSEWVQTDNRTPGVVLALMEDAVMKAMMRERQRGR